MCGQKRHQGRPKMQSERKHKYSQNTLGAAENQAGGNMICGKQQVDKSYLESLLKKFTSNVS